MNLNYTAETKFLVSI